MNAPVRDGRLRPQWILLNLLSMSACLYTALLFTSPVYFVYAFAAPLLLLSGLHRIDSAPLDAALAMLLLVTIGVASLGEFSGSLANLACGLIGYVAIRLHARDLSARHWDVLCGRAAWSGALLLATDSAYRLLAPQVPDPQMIAALEASGQEFYLLKFGGFMFADSNTTALCALCLLAMLLRCWKAGSRIPLGASLLLVAVILSSFSRSAYVSLGALAFGTVVFRYPRLALSFTLVAVAFALSVSWGDSSLESKFIIFDTVRRHLDGLENPVQFLFGVGLDRSAELFGLHTHIIWLTYLVEAGFFGLTIFLCFLASLFLADRQAWFVLTPLIVSGLSYFLYLGAPFLFTPLALTLALVAARTAPVAQGSQADLQLLVPAMDRRLQQ